MLLGSTDTPEKQEQWIKSGIPLLQTASTLRQALVRLRSTGSLTTCVTVYRVLLLLQFLLLRGIIVNRANFRYMNSRFARHVRGAQRLIETTLLRTGMPPAFLSSAQTMLTQLVADMSGTLNKLALQRSRDQGKSQQAGTAGADVDTLREGRIAQRGDSGLAEQLEEDKAGKLAFWFSLSHAAASLRFCFYFRLFLSSLE